jgi:hypothetical protein
MIPTSQGSRDPVKREGAERYILLSLVSFAASVVLTRLFLELTGYPQIATSTLHIAHVLWGGLLLFVAALLPLILANRWAFNWSAILSGLGVGLFIDEVGKFITQTNDYFYPPAAPIIYAFFLLTVLLYLRVRRPPTRTPRSELYRILEGLTEVLDHEMDDEERLRMENRLLQVGQETEDPNMKRLVRALVDFLEEEHFHAAEPSSGRLERFGKAFIRNLNHAATQPRLKMFLVVSLGVMGFLVMIEFAYLVIGIPAPEPALELLVSRLIARGIVESQAAALWFVIRIILEGITGILLIFSGALITIRRERTGIQIATMTLIVWLTVINVLIFYQDQFGAVITALVQFFVLLALTYYRRRYLAIH